MEWYEFEIEMARSSIAMDKRIIKTNFGLILLNVGLCLWNIYNLWIGVSHLSWLTGIAIGCTGTSSLWTWLTMWETKLDLKNEKEKISRLEKFKEIKLNVGANNQLWK